MAGYRPSSSSPTNSSTISATLPTASATGSLRLIDIASGLKPIEPGSPPSIQPRRAQN
jgi:hypothetical protein